MALLFLFRVDQLDGNVTINENGTKYRILRGNLPLQINFYARKVHAACYSANHVSAYGV